MAENLNPNGSVKRSRLATIAAEGDPLKVVAFIPIGSKLRRRRNGYWFARTPARPGVLSEVLYVGSDEDKAILESAWAMVRAKLESIEATPEGQQLRQLQELVGAGPPVVAPLARTAPEPERPRAAARGGRRPKR